MIKVYILIKKLIKRFFAKILTFPSSNYYTIINGGDLPVPL